MTRRMVGAARHPETNVLGHCTGRLVTGGRGTRAQSSFDAEAVFGACAENGVAVEINSRPERRDPPDELVAVALEAGCLFSIDSDAHAPGQLDFLAYGAERAAAARRAHRAHRQHLAGGPAARLGQRVACQSWPLSRHLEHDGPRRRGAPVAQAAPDGGRLPRGRQGRGAPPGPVHARRGEGVGGHHARPGSSGRSGAAAPATPPCGAAPASSAPLPRRRGRPADRALGGQPEQPVGQLHARATGRSGCPPGCRGCRRGSSTTSWCTSSRT